MKFSSAIVLLGGASSAMAAGVPKIVAGPFGGFSIYNPYAASTTAASSSSSAASSTSSSAKASSTSSAAGAAGSSSVCASGATVTVTATATATATVTSTSTKTSVSTSVSTSISTSVSTTTATSTTTTTTIKTVTPTPTAVCLTNSSSNYLVNGFASLLTAYDNNVAEALLSSSFTDTSDSINILAGYPLGATTFPSKTAFEQGQGSEPAIGFTVLEIDAVTCNTVVFRWSAQVGGSDAVQGIDILVGSNLNGTDAGWQIQTIYSEFNSCAWMIDIGGTCGFS